MMAKNKFLSLPGMVFTMLIALWNTHAWSIGIAQYSAFINSPDLYPDSLEDTQIGSGYNDFQDFGLNVAFTNNLNAEGLGAVKWKVTNNSGRNLASVWFFGFLDAEIDEPINSYFNESGVLVSVSGAGSGDAAADSWEIDEPGFTFGDIYNNLLAGSLDNGNGVPAGSEDDVSLALGFDVGSLLAGESILAMFDTSLTNIGGLSHADPDSNLTFYFNGVVEVQPLSVPEPGTLMLVIIGMAGLTMRITFFSQ
ncbi:MAG TPA: PEP-CTERM sorting domain-containing protein [Sedimenticola sp.]|nr:PEP-CTERM sorting domain-containing protein [Sedimenticola sp.]